METKVGLIENNGNVVEIIEGLNSLKKGEFFVLYGNKKVCFIQHNDKRETKLYTNSYCIEDTLEIEAHSPYYEDLGEISEILDRDFSLNENVTMLWTINGWKKLKREDETDETGFTFFTKK